MDEEEEEGEEEGEEGEGVATSLEWCTTDWGFIQTRMIEMIYVIAKQHSTASVELKLIEWQKYCKLQTKLFLTCSLLHTANSCQLWGFNVSHDSRE